MADNSILDLNSPGSAIAYLRGELATEKVSGVVVAIQYEDESNDAAIFNMNARDLLWISERLKIRATEDM